MTVAYPKLIQRAALAGGSVVAALATDVVTKWVILNIVMVPPRTIEITPFFNLTLLHNTGAAFSFLAEHAGWQRWLFALIAIGASIGLTVWLSRLKRGETLTAVSLTLVIGGAIGNLYDRLVHGYVVDYLSFHWGGWYYPAFNLADTAITLGAVGLVLQSLFDSRRPKASRDSSKGPSSSTDQSSSTRGDS